MLVVGLICGYRSERVALGGFFKDGISDFVQAYTDLFEGPYLQKFPLFVILFYLIF